MKRVLVDFNTLTSEPVGLVKIADPEDVFATPPFEQGERVLLVDSDLEAEGESRRLFAASLTAHPNHR
jgi:hypothetical protein